MICIFCERDIDFIRGKHNTCSFCNSYFQFYMEKEDYYIYHAYPDANKKKDFENTTLRIEK